MPKTILGVQMLKENKIPYFVVANVNIGGVSASFGSLGDFHIMEPGKKQSGDLPENVLFKEQSLNRYQKTFNLHHM